MKTLVIAEKPSVAQDIVRALTPVAGKVEKHDDHFESDSYVVTSAVGHLVEIQAPEQYDVKRGKWSFANLPVIPPHFDLKPVDKTKSRLSAVLNQAEDQFPLAARVTGVDQCRHILALGLFDHRAQAALGLVDGLQVKVRRDDRQVGKAPLAALDVVLLGRLDLDQVTDRAGDDIAVALEVVVVFLEFARHGREGPNDVLCHRWLFCNDQCLHSVGNSALYNATLACAHVYARPLMCAHTRTCMNSTYQIFLTAVSYTHLTLPTNREV